MTYFPGCRLAYIRFQATKLIVLREEGRILLRELREFFKEIHKSGKLPSPGTPKVIAKKRKQKRLTSEEFLRIYEILWEEGPKVKYVNPDNWVEHR